MDRTIERRAQGNHTTNLIGHRLSDLAGVDATQAPTNDADLLAAVARQLSDMFDAARKDPWPRSKVQAKIPWQCGIAARPKKATQRDRREIIGRQTG